MASEKDFLFDPDYACKDFAHRHNILNTPMVQRETLAIYWTLRTKLEVDNELKEHTEKLNQTDPLCALLLSMLDRTFEYTEGSIAALVTGSTASSEVITRTVVESAINLLVVLVDDKNGSRLSQYFACYFDKEQEEIDKWIKLAANMKGEESDVHRSSALGKRNAINQLKQYTNTALSQIGLPTTEKLEKRWPDVAGRFHCLKLDIDYRTLYAALCSQTHSDADLLNYFVSVSLGNRDWSEKVSLETVNFSRFMVYFGVKYYLIAAEAYTIRFELSNAMENMKSGRDIIAKQLENISTELRPRD